MATIDDYVARVEGTCGAEKDVIVVFKYDKKDEAIANILKKAQVKNKIAGIIFELTFQDNFFQALHKWKSDFSQHQKQRRTKPASCSTAALDKTKSI